VFSFLLRKVLFPGITISEFRKSEITTALLGELPSTGSQMYVGGILWEYGGTAFLPIKPLRGGRDEAESEDTKQPTQKK
jgi:hypothetical protein